MFTDHTLRKKVWVAVLASSLAFFSCKNPVTPTPAAPTVTLDLRGEPTYENCTVTISNGTVTIPDGFPDVSSDESRVIFAWYKTYDEATDSYLDEWNPGDPARGGMTLYARWADKVTIKNAGAIALTITPLEKPTVVSVEYACGDALISELKTLFNKQVVYLDLEKSEMTSLPLLQESELLETVKLPDTLKTIPDYAFDGCTRLKTIDIPDSVASIGTAAFRNCKKLSSVVVPENVTEIKNETFKVCTAITVALNADAAMTQIGESAFEDCWTISTITLPDTVTSIGASAFKGCKALATINLAHVTTVGASAFEGASLQQADRFLLLAAFRILLCFFFLYPREQHLCIVVGIADRIRSACLADRQTAVPAVLNHKAAFVILAGLGTNYKHKL
ncbi:MAG: leucine-rich repeat domain-containing protein [Treponema sp.]|nr:leucine-rich repeat domain-containing protein [Treponema sp.]